MLYIYILLLLRFPHFLLINLIFDTPCKQRYKSTNRKTKHCLYFAVYFIDVSLTSYGLGFSHFL